MATVDVLLLMRVADRFWRRRGGWMTTALMPSDSRPMPRLCSYCWISPETPVATSIRTDFHPFRRLVPNSCERLVPCTRNTPQVHTIG